MEGMFNGSSVEVGDGLLILKSSRMRRPNPGHSGRWGRHLARPPLPPGDRTVEVAAGNEDGSRQSLAPHSGDARSSTSWRLLVAAPEGLVVGSNVRVQHPNPLGGSGSPNGYSSEGRADALSRRLLSSATLWEPWPLSRDNIIIIIYSYKSLTVYLLWSHLPSQSAASCFIL
jgi:hypothetical protein